MNNLKKIGLSALAGSLVAFSANAGEMTVTGGAQLFMSSSDKVGKTTFSNSDHVNFDGSTELDNGMTVSMSFELDSGVDTGTGTGPFDNHSVTVSSDALGTLVFAGHGGSSAQGALDTTASGDIWDQTLGITGITAAASGDDSLHYTLPEVMEGLAISASLSPGRAAQESHTAYGLVYTGYDGLTLKYGVGDSGAPGSETESTTMMASYAIGPITASVSQTEADNTGAANRTVDSFGIAYTVSDELSISYGSDTFDLAGNAVDEEVEAIGVSYTSGGMTISANQYEAKGAGNSASAKTDKWSLSASFAF
jgi:outer membrane protein OmpU